MPLCSSLISGRTYKVWEYLLMAAIIPYPSKVYVDATLLSI